MSGLSGVSGLRIGAAREPAHASDEAPSEPAR